MDIEVTMPDGQVLDVTLPDGLSDSEIQKEVDGVEAAYLLDANPEYLSSNAITESEANASLRLGKGVTVQMPLGQDATQGEESPRITEEQRMMLEDARLQSTPSALAARDQQRAIEQARREALQEEGYTILPLLREARVKGSGEEVATLRDLASLPGKGWGALFDLVTGEDPRVDMDKTSDELLSKGRVGRSILASPSLVPSTLAAIYTGGMSIPAQIGGQVASNALFMPDYGGENMALDAIITALPAGVGLIAGKTKAAGISAIEKALSSKGIKKVSPDMLERVYSSLAKGRTAEKIVAESGEKLAKELAGPVIGKSDVPTMGILRNLTVPEPTAIPASAFDRARSAILASVKRKGGRSLDEAQEAIARVNSMESSQARIATMQAEGGYSPESYYRDTVNELAKVSDIPEIVKEAEGYISKSAKEVEKDKIRLALSLSSGRPLPRPPLPRPPIPDANLAGPISDLQVGSTLRSIYGGQGRGILDVISEPTVAARAVAASPTGKLLAEKALRGPSYVAPTILNRLYNQGENK